MQERPMQWFTGSAWSSAGASPFPRWRAAFTVRLVSTLVAVSLTLKIRIWDADRILLLKMDRSPWRRNESLFLLKMNRIMPMRIDWIPFLSENGPEPAYENGLNPLFLLKMDRILPMRRIESRVCLALKMDRDPVCMRMNWIRTRPWKIYHIQILPLRMGRILPIRMDRIPFLLWKMDRDPVCMIMN